jgi:hypothetical protein
LGRDLADATQAIAEAVQDVRYGAGRWNGLIGSGGVGNQMLVNGCGGDPSVAERGVELGVGLRVRFDQDVDLLDQLGVVVFGLVSSAAGEVVKAADAGAEFAETGRDGVASPAEDLFGASWLTVAVLEGHFGLELPAAKAGEFASGGKNDIKDGRSEVGVHDSILVREGTAS